MVELLLLLLLLLVLLFVLLVLLLLLALVLVLVLLVLLELVGTAIMEHEVLFDVLFVDVRFVSLLLLLLLLLPVLILFSLLLTNEPLVLSLRELFAGFVFVVAIDVVEADSIVCVGSITSLMLIVKRVAQKEIHSSALSQLYLPLDRLLIAQM